MAVQVLCVIPARIGSTRLPHKPLRLLSGEPIVRHVARRARELDFAARVVVAADHPRVVDAVSGLGVDAVLTDPALGSGTERVATVSGLPDHAHFPIVLNIQGDQPFFPLEAVMGALQRVRVGDPIGTVGSSIVGNDLTDRNRVKVVVDAAGRALRFSRVMPASFAWQCEVDVLYHIGIYAYRRSVLKQWLRWRPAPGERTEGLEQLRPLHHGLTVGVARVGGPVASAIDTEQDLAKAETYVDMATQR